MGEDISLKSERKNHDLTFSAHTINCMCHSIRSMFRVLGIHNFGTSTKWFLFGTSHGHLPEKKNSDLKWQLLKAVYYTIVVPKLYTPSTLNIALILWHIQLIVCAVK